ncbi:DUF4815 domain-containing protein [Candidatus Albibeggiatoa sp. nov. BB20]|uniref:DUF4815 domain-containing protein n=1 Tax=Candidatus Albibeggiatoa sp. nov. BB20 TaxID=3162723 RepID=UPI0033654BFE
MAKDIGVSYTRDNTGVRPLPLRDTSAIHAIVTAPDADKNIFPVGKNVLMNGNDLKLRAALGNRGTAPWVLDAIFDQGIQPQIILSVVERSPKPKTSVYQSVRNDLIHISGEQMNRAADGVIDSLANSDVNMVTRVWSGDTVYSKDTDWKRTANSIEWLTYVTTETVKRSTSTTDPLDFQDKALAVSEISQGETQYVLDTDFQLTEFGIEWLTETQPTVHSEYLVTYSYGKRPASEQDYEVDYSHYKQEEVIGEVITRSQLQTYDYAKNSDILRILEIRQGAESFTAETDYKLADDRIEWQTYQETETVTRGSGITDAVIHSAHLLDASQVEKDGNIFTKGVDWTVSGTGEIEWTGANIAEPAQAETYNVTYSHGHRPEDETNYELDYEFKPGEIVALDEVIGGFDIEAGIMTGVHTALAAEQETGVRPKILIAPGFTHHAAVVQEMIGIAEQLLAFIYADGPSTERNIDAAQYRAEFGSERVMIVDPWVQFYNNQSHINDYDYQPASARIAGLRAKIDAEKGAWWSISNHEMLGITGLYRKIGRSNPTANTDASAENYLRQADVTTIVRSYGGDGGWLTAGNRTCSNDVQFMFEPVVRVDDMVEEAIVRGMQKYRDNPIDAGYFNTLARSLEQFLRSLEQQGAIILGSQSPVWIDPASNSPDQIKQGIAKINFDLEFKYPAENIRITRSINFEYLEQMFTNVEYVRQS